MALFRRPLPHVLMMPYPLPGHITPLLQLSKLLAARGLIVTFVTSNFNVRKMLSSEQELHKLGIHLVGIPDGLQDTHQPEVMLEPDDFIASLIYMHTSFDELVRKMVQEEGLTITCIISDSFMLWTQDVANKWRIPRVSFWPNSLAALACSISLPKIEKIIKAELGEICDAKLYFSVSNFINKASSSNFAVYENGAGEQLRCIPGISQIGTSMLPFYTLGGEVSEQWMRHHVESQMERVNEVLCIICNSFPDLEKEVHMQLKELLPCTVPMVTVGPLFLSEGEGGEKADADDEECMRWLDMQQPRSVIYISLGSVAHLEEKEIEEMALGIEASKQPFLWVVRTAPCEAALKWMTEEGRGRGKVIRWAPQVRVLSHEAVGGFLTHCGWNSTLESVSKGVPVIAWPQMMDQMTNCWYLVDKEKVGMRLEFEKGCKIGRAGVERSIRRLMQQEEGRLLRERSSRFPPLALFSLTSSLPSHLDSLVQCILSSRTTSPSLHAQT